MARLRWGVDAPDDPEAARGRLLTAAEACFGRFGVMKTTVEDVANEAKVSRATVYRYFEGRDELVLGVLLMEARRFLTKLQKRIAAQPNISDAIVEGVLFTVDAVRADTNLALLFAPETAGVTEAIVGASDTLFATTSEFLRPYFEAAQAAGTLRPDIDIDEAAEWIVRCIISLLTVSDPRRRTKAQQKKLLRALLVPALVVA
ncbi:MAG TPA: TetR/AcrR family transcriptional regulator [Acidimicrobiales bacterium]|nr:TetR/AcrR family transcriptional regulator [Acidimicrobiales bacterium]